MSRGWLVGLLLGVWFVAPSANAQGREQPTYEMTFEEAMQLARQQGPYLAAARARVGEARAQADAASVWRFNPQLELSVGPRFGATATTVDWSIGAQQGFDLGQRGQRIHVARAGIDTAEARADDAARALLREVGLAFVHALYWTWRVELGHESLRLAQELEGVARRRREVGDTGGLDHSIASVSLARSQTAIARAQVELGQAAARLKILLGLEAGAKLVARGDLRQLGTSPWTPPADAAVRADLRVLAAELREADAQADLGRAAWIPDVALGVGYSREEQGDIVQGSLSFALPLFDHGQGTTAMAEARRGRVETELRGSRRRAAVEIETATQTSRRLAAAARQFEEQGLAALEHSERLSAASYEAGAMPLGELLALRRELVQAKIDYADLLLGAAAARVELTASAGALPRIGEVSP